jgi:hypothetical protein
MNRRAQGARKNIRDADNSSRLMKTLSESFDWAQDERRGLISLMFFRSAELDEA